MSDEPQMGEQALSRAAEMMLSSQLDTAEKIDVDVRTNLLNVVQGEVDSVSVTGHGLVMQKDIRVQEMELHTDHISINPLSAILGKFELNQAIDATARLVLTEQDINRTLNCNYVRNKLQNFELDVEGQTAIVEPLHMELHLPSDGRMIFTADTLLHNEIGKTKKIGFTAVILVKTDEQPLLIEGFNCTSGQGVSIELVSAFMRKLGEVVNSSHVEFELEEMALRVKDIDVQEGILTLHAEAHVKHLPSL